MVENLNNLFQSTQLLQSLIANIDELVLFYLCRKSIRFIQIQNI